MDADRDESLCPEVGEPTAEGRSPDDPEQPWSAPASPSAFRLAGYFLLPFDDARYDDAPAWRRAAAWLPVWGLLIGVIYAGIFRLAWRGFGEYQHVRLVPMAVLLAADLVFFGHRLLVGAIEVIWCHVQVTTGARSPAASVTTLRGAVAMATAVIVLALLKYTLLLSLPIGAWVWPADWREHLGPLYPPVIYRPLILMALWGRWGMMLAVTIGRVADDAPKRLRLMAEGRHLPGVMVVWLGCSGLTVAYIAASAEHIARAALICLGMMLTAYLVSFLLARLVKGQNQATILAVGMAVELAFLAAYVPAARSIYWY